MNRHQIDLLILQKLLRATVACQVQWQKDRDQQFSTTLGGEQIAFRFLWYEATNQVGADPRVIELTMPGRKAVFSFGTEGCDLLFDILSTAFDEWRRPNAFDPLKFLDDALSG